jgi:hypothetical protein
MTLVGPEMKPPEIKGVSGWMEISCFGIKVWVEYLFWFKYAHTLALLNKLNIGRQSALLST